MEPKSHQVSALLAELFEPAELKKFILEGFGKEVLYAIDFGGGWAIQCWNAASALERRGFISDMLRALLVAARPAKTAQINAVWGVATPFVSGSSVPTPPPVQRPTVAPAPSPAPAADVVRILHISDLHLHPGTAPNHDGLLGEALEAIGALVAEGRGPQLVALTGDLAHHGQPVEFDLVRAWLTDKLLPTVGLSPADVLVVPGNHDLDRKVARGIATRHTEQEVRRSAEEADAVLADPDAMALFHRRYAAYLDFLTRLGVSHPPTPGWHHRRTVAGVALHLVGLDTAWLHSDDDLKGRLVLGRRPVDLALNARQQGDLVIALSHHPLDWLTEWDQADVAPPIHKHAHVHLHGHLHANAPVYAQGAGYRLTTLPAGAMYQGHRWANGFQLVELDPKAQRGLLHPHVWLPQDHRWSRDLTRYPPLGRWPFPLER